MRYNARWLRQQLGVVPQEPTLFDLTVEENIKLGHPSATQSDVVRAAKVANALGFILALPAGLQTRLGHGSVTLSGGQKQRLSIARAVVRRPRLLLLDEFTSALDTASEADVVQALAQAMEGCTTISIAHRPGAMMAMDQAFVFSDGRIIEWGPVDRLLEQGAAACGCGAARGCGVVWCGVVCRRRCYRKAKAGMSTHGYRETEGLCVSRARGVRVCFLRRKAGTGGPGGFPPGLRRQPRAVGVVGHGASSAACRIARRSGAVGPLVYTAALPREVGRGLLQ